MRQVLAIPILICALVLSAACGETSNPGIPSVNNGGTSAGPSAGRGDVMAFVRCLREHGVNIPDPNPDIAWQQAEQSPAWDAASVACQHLAPAAPPGAQPGPGAEELEQLRTFAVCMRARDIDMSDPDPATGNMTIRGRLENVTRTQLENDPGYKAAYEACKDKLPRETNDGRKQ